MSEGSWLDTSDAYNFLSKAAQDDNAWMSATIKPLEIKEHETPQSNWKRKQLFYKLLSMQNKLTKGVQSLNPNEVKYGAVSYRGGHSKRSRRRPRKSKRGTKRIRSAKRKVTRKR